VIRVFRLLALGASKVNAEEPTEMIVSPIESGGGGGL
jgi:hypothetical protein